jgi:hypothetical protein
MMKKGEARPRSEAVEPQRDQTGKEREKWERTQAVQKVLDYFAGRRELGYTDGSSDVLVLNDGIAICRRDGKKVNIEFIVGEPIHMDITLNMTDPE